MKKLRLLVCFAVLLLGLVSPARSTSQEMSDIRDLDWSTDGSRLAVGYQDGTINILNASFQLVRTFDVGEPMSFDWSPGPHISWLAVANRNGEIRVIDVDTGQAILQIEDFYDFRIFSIAWSPDESRLATGHAVGSLLPNPGGVIKVWNSSTGQLETSYGHYKHGHGVHVLSWSPDGIFLASSSQDGWVIIWNSSLDEIAHHFNTGGSGLAKWSPDGTKLVTFTDILTLQTWNTTTLEPEVVLHDMSVSGIYEYEWRPGTSELAIATGNAVVLMDAITGQEISVTPTDARVVALAWTPDGRRLAYGGSGRLPDILDLSPQHSPTAPTPQPSE